jgi:hypothetical protein
MALNPQQKALIKMLLQKNAGNSPLVTEISEKKE